MIVASGFPALRSGDVTYFVGGISRLVGFIDGLKEGAQVTIEGSARTVSQDGKIKYLRPKKMTLNGKSYDLALPELNIDQIRDRFRRMAQPGTQGQFWPRQTPRQIPQQPPRHAPPQPPRQKHQPPRQFPPRVPQQPWSNYGRR
jgi:hypothetical protein